MSVISDLNVRTVDKTVDPEIHNTKEAKRLKESCQQFESIFLAEIWKKMGTLSRKISGKEDRDRPFAQMEDLALEMTAEELSKSGGLGVWKQLYDDLIPQIASTVSAEELAGLEQGEAANLKSGEIADLKRGADEKLSRGVAAEAARLYSKAQGL